MHYEADHSEAYIEQLPSERREPVARLLQTVRDNLPPGFVETISSGMIVFAVPHSIYPAGYHVKPEEPVPFIGIASQKQHVAFYHLGVYAMPDLLAWLEAEYPKHARTKLDMGKSCIRFRKMDDIPYDLIAELCRKITVEQYIKVYEASKPQGTGRPGKSTSGK